MGQRRQPRIIQPGVEAAWCHHGQVTEKRAAHAARTGRRHGAHTRALGRPSPPISRWVRTTKHAASTNMRHCERRAADSPGQRKMRAAGAAFARRGGAPASFARNSFLRRLPPPAAAVAAGCDDEHSVAQPAARGAAAAAAGLAQPRRVGSHERTAGSPRCGACHRRRHFGQTPKNLRQTDEWSGPNEGTLQCP